MDRPIALTLGDRYGVGPELVAGLLADLPAGLPPLVVIGDPAVLAAGAAAAGVTLDSATAEGPEGAAGRAWVLVPRPGDLPVAPMGRMEPDAGAEVLALWDDLIGWAAEGRIGGIVYAPLNKQAVKAAGHAAGDELDYLVPRLPARGATGEINVLDRLWTSRVTSHVPLSQVADLIDADRISRAVRLVAEARARAGFEQNRIAVAALNPHAGEGGLYGTEEEAVIAPAVAALRAEGLDVTGPWPADTVFPRALREGLDAVVTMFHDQGQIALKMMGLGESVTLLAGFVVPVGTPGHGTAYDIAGQGLARPDGLRSALSLVARMAAREAVEA